MVTSWRQGEEFFQKNLVVSLDITTMSCYNSVVIERLTTKNNLLEVFKMKMAVVCANGRVGRLVVKEAIDRGLDVTAVAKGENETATKEYICKDLLDLTKADLEGFDVVVDAFGAWAEEELPNHTKSLMHLCDILSGKKTRLVVVGGAGSLYVNPEHTAVVSDGPDFPPQFLPLAKAQGKALEELRKRNDVQWTFISPAGEFQAEGERTGEYILAGEEFTLNSRGESIISYADYAIAMVDEITKGNHIQQRISVVRK